MSGAEAFAEYQIVAIYSQRKEAATAAATEYAFLHVAEVWMRCDGPMVDRVLVLTTSSNMRRVSAQPSMQARTFTRVAAYADCGQNLPSWRRSQMLRSETQIGLQRPLHPHFVCS